MNKKTVSKVNLFSADLFREWKKTKIFLMILLLI